MLLKSKKIIVTGGAGFIGSNLVARLLSEGANVTVYDNLSSGKKEFLEIGHPGLTFIEGDILDTDKMKNVFSGHEILFHMAANPDVKLGTSDTYVHLEQNVIATYRVLEAMAAADVKTICFTSTSTVYGEAAVIPTPEGYGPLLPISLYGSSKLAAEAYISAYADLCGINAVIYRFANVVGPRSTHGVTFDFVNNLRANPAELTILGDGKQKKSYFYIDDCVDGMLFSLENHAGGCDVYNIGSADTCTVTEIADTVAEAMGLSDVEYKYTGGIDGGKGWKGDVKYMQLAIDKLESMGWRPTCTSMDAIRRTADHLFRSA